MPLPLPFPPRGCVLSVFPLRSLPLPCVLRTVPLAFCCTQPNGFTWVNTFPIRSRSFVRYTVRNSLVYLQLCSPCVLSYIPIEFRTLYHAVRMRKTILLILKICKSIHQYSFFGQLKNWTSYHKLTADLSNFFSIYTFSLEPRRRRQRDTKGPGKEYNGDGWNWH